MKASMLTKSLIIGIVFFLLLLLAGNASSEVKPIYAGWTVGQSWDDGSGTSYGTILRSTDSGNTWTRQGAGQIADVDMWGVVAVDPYTAWVVGDPADGYATIYHTSDGGINWDRKGTSADVLRDVKLKLRKVTAYGDNKVWAVAEGYVGGAAILHTSDGGATWTNQIPVEYHDALLQGVHTPDGNTVWVTSFSALDGYVLILKSSDAGLTWTRQSGGDVVNWYHILGISAVDADTAWAIAARHNDMESAVLGTSDGGATWTPQVYTSLDGNEVCAVDASTVWAVTDTAIHWSSDGGVSWTDHTTWEYTMGISAVSSQEAWAVRGWEVGGVGSIYHTPDGGKTWTKVEKLCDECEMLPSLWTISFATQPINLNDMITSLIEDVEQLVDTGDLNKGQDNALIVKLEHALDHLTDDRLKATVNVLGAFSNQVEAFIQGGVLTDEIGQELSEQVDYIIELFGLTL